MIFQASLANAKQIINTIISYNIAGVRIIIL